MSCNVSPQRLVAWLDGELRPAPAARLAAHVATCPKCSDCVTLLARQAEALRAEIGRDVPPTTLARLRHVLPPTDRPEAWPEVLTLDEVARYLRVNLDDLDHIATDLPAFEIGGQIRVRRSALAAWIAQRERDYEAQRLCAVAAGPAPRQVI